MRVEARRQVFRSFPGPRGSENEGRVRWGGGGEKTASSEKPSESRTLVARTVVDGVVGRSTIDSPVTCQRDSFRKRPARFKKSEV